MKNYRVNARQLGFILIIVSAALFLIVLSFTAELIKAQKIECEQVCGPEDVQCPHTQSIPLQSYAGFSAAFILAAIGAFMVFNGKKYQEEISKKEKKLEKTITSLKGNERKISKAIQEAGGAIFQSELVETTGFSKSKVSRVLDKLEAKGLIKRRRRGMSNLVLLKK